MADHTHAAGPSASDAALDIAFERMRSGEPGGDESFLALVYGDLRRIAAARLRRSAPGASIQATELVHEAYLRLARCRRLDWRDRLHVIAVAATAMRHVLADRARRRGRRRRRAPGTRVSLDDVVAASSRELEAVELFDALDALERVSARGARIAELRLFGGLDAAECAELLGMSRRTVERDWQVVRRWLAALCV